MWGGAWFVLAMCIHLSVYCIPMHTSPKRTNTNTNTNTNI